MTVSHSCWSHFVLLLPPLLVCLILYHDYDSYVLLHSLTQKAINPEVCDLHATTPQALSVSTISINGVAQHILGHDKKKSRMEKIEAELDRARAKILKAIRRKNFTSVNSNNIFIPRGRLYRNPYAFHQSHKEMVKKFKIWVYKEGEPPLFHIAPMKDIYSIEGQLIAELEAGNNPFLASHPDEAHAFFVPVSVTNIVHYIYSPLATFDRDRLFRIVRDYVMVISSKYPYWNATSGADHFMVSCHDWCYAMPTPLKDFNPLKMHQYLKSTGPPSTLNIPRIGLPPGRRRILAFFAGGNHGCIRESLLQHWKDKDREVLVHDYLPNAHDYLKFMRQSKYCLCPSGYEVASPRIVEAINSGCVPVILSDHYSLPFSDVLDWTQFSVNVPVANISEIKSMLKSIPFNKYLKMQRMVIRVQRHFEVNRPAKPFDVLHMLLHSVWLRRLKSPAVVILKTQTTEIYPFDFGNFSFNPV